MNRDPLWDTAGSQCVNLNASEILESMSADVPRSHTGSQGLRCENDASFRCRRAVRRSPAARPRSGAKTSGFYMHRKLLARRMNYRWARGPNELHRVTRVRRRAQCRELENAHFPQLRCSVAQRVPTGDRGCPAGRQTASRRHPSVRRCRVFRAG